MVALNILAVGLMAHFFLRGIREIRIDPTGLSIRRLRGTRQQLPRTEIEKVVNTQSQGMRSIRVVTRAGPKVFFTEHMSNFDLLVETIAERTGSALQGSTERLTRSELQGRVIYAYEPRLTSLDRLFLIHVEGATLRFLRVGGQLWSSDSAPRSEDPATYVKPELLDRYRDIEFAGPAALSVDPANFEMPRAAIRSVDLRSRRALWTGPVPNSGSLVINPVRGKPKRYILLGRQEHNAVATTLRQAGIHVERSAQ